MELLRLVIYALPGPYTSALRCTTYVSEVSPGCPYQGDLWRLCDLVESCVDSGRHGINARTVAFFQVFWPLPQITISSDHTCIVKLDNAFLKC